MEETLHPYFDDIEDELWLRAAIVQTIPSALRFFVVSPVERDPVLAERTRRHFKMFDLASLYASQGAQELQNIKHYLINLLNRAGADGVRSHLIEIGGSCEIARKNSWQTAAYNAWAESDWFCDGGFV